MANLPPITPEMLMQMGMVKPAPIPLPQRMGGPNMDPMRLGSPGPPMMGPGGTIPPGRVPVSQMMQSALPGLVPRTDPYLEMALKVMKLAGEDPDAVQEMRREMQPPKQEVLKVYDKVVDIADKKFRQEAPKPSISGVMEKIHGKKNTGTGDYQTKDSSGVTGSDTELPIG